MSLKFVPRDEWAGDIRPNKSNIPRIPTPTRTLWLHHGASGKPTRATARAYLKYHLSKNWWDIGYNFLPTTDEVLVGRGEGRQGGHTIGQNISGSGICAVGDYDRYQPEEDLISNIVQLVRIGHERGWWPEGFTGGHRDAPDNETRCPGRYLYSRLEEINRRIRDDKDPVKTIPSGVVTVGDRGELVEKWQKLLAELLPNHPAAHAADGHFGPKTLDWSIAAYRDVGVSVRDPQRPRVGPRSFQAVQDAIDARREPWHGKKVVSKVDGLRFYDSPRWDDPTGTFDAGYSFPTIKDKVSVGSGKQYEVYNSSGSGPFYVTASTKFVEVA